MQNIIELGQQLMTTPTQAFSAYWDLFWSRARIKVLGLIGSWIVLGLFYVSKQVYLNGWDQGMNRIKNSITQNIQDLVQELVVTLLPLGARQFITNIAALPLTVTISINNGPDFLATENIISVIGYNFDAPLHIELMQNLVASEEAPVIDLDLPNNHHAAAPHIVLVEALPMNAAIIWDRDPVQLAALQNRERRALSL